MTNSTTAPMKATKIEGTLSPVTCSPLPNWLNKNPPTKAPMIPTMIFVTKEPDPLFTTKFPNHPDTAPTSNHTIKFSNILFLLFLLKTFFKVSYILPQAIKKCTN